MLKIGWASRDVTPDRPVLLRGQFHARISTHVQDPLTVTALALEADGEGRTPEQAVMVSCDRVAISRQVVARVRELIAPRVPEFDTGKLFLNATHTHTAPTINEGLYPPTGEGVMSPTECAEFLADGVADAVVEAWQKRAAGGLSWGFGHAVVGHNRRLKYADGSAKMYGSADQPDFDSVEGYEDHGVDLLFTWDTDQKLTGIAVNLACPAQVTEGENYVSADFWHEARQEIRSRLSDGLFILPQCSAAGDQSPHLLLHKREEELMRQRRGVTEREEIGRRIADCVDDVLPLARLDIRTSMPFRHVVRTIDLPMRVVTEQECRAAQTAYDELAAASPANEFETSRRFVLMRRNREVIERCEQQGSAPVFPMELHAIRLGDVAIATSNFEVFLDFGLRIKARSRALQTFVVQLCGDATYLPTAKAVAARSYGAEVASNLIGPEGGQELVERTIELINPMWDDAGPTG